MGMKNGCWLFGGMEFGEGRVDLNAKVNKSLIICRSDNTRADDYLV